MGRGEQVIATARDVTAAPLPDEFECMFHEHSEFVFRTACRVTGSEQDAEDVLQTLFLRLLTNPVPKEGDPKGYLYRAAVNLSLNIVRQRKRVVLTDDADR